MKVIVNPYHDKKNNISSFSKVFDWGTCEVSLTLGNGSSILDIIGLENEATSFDINKISIYGIAKCGDVYKGIGIIKD